jgi:hypothetical protein
MQRELLRRQRYVHDGSVDERHARSEDGRGQDQEPLTVARRSHARARIAASSH